jgi:hypothetical protein
VAVGQEAAQVGRIAEVADAEVARLKVLAGEAAFETGDPFADGAEEVEVRVLGQGMCLPCFAVGRR